MRVVVSRMKWGCVYMSVISLVYGLCDLFFGWIWYLRNLFPTFEVRLEEKEPPDARNAYDYLRHLRHATGLLRLTEHIFDYVGLGRPPSA